MALHSLRLLIDVGDEKGIYEFDPAVFWGVNGFIGFMLLCLIAWCVCFGGKDSLTQWVNSQQETERQLQRSVLRSRQAGEEAKDDSPSELIKKLKRSFEKSGVTMVVEEGDIIKVLPEGSESNFDDTLRDGISNNGSFRDSVSIAMGVVAELEEEENNKQASNSNTDTESSDNAADNETKNDENDNNADNDGNDEERHDIETADEAAESISVGSGHFSVGSGRSGHFSVGSGLRSLGGSIASAGHASLVGSILSSWSGGLSQLSGQPMGYIILRENKPNNDKNTRNYFRYNKSKNNKTVEQTEDLQPRKTRYAANGCAVCLGSFKVGEQVVWSTNQRCQHVYHEECIIEWLVKMQNGSCPCCRQEFSDLPEFKKKKEKSVQWAAGQTFNVSHIGF